MNNIFKLFILLLFNLFSFANENKDLDLLYNNAINFYNDKEYFKSFKIFEKLSEENHLPSKLQMINMYVDGQGVEKNDTKAFNLLIELNNNNFPNSKYLLAYAYYNGIGTIKNLNLAKENFKKSLKIDKDYRSAYYLGLLAKDINDYKNTIYYFKLASDNNIKEAIASLGYCYYDGFGVKKDLNKSIDLFKKISDFTNLKHVIGSLYQKQNKYDEAKYWYELSIKDNNEIYSYLNLGIIYSKGLGNTKKDKDKTIELFNKILEDKTIENNIKYSIVLFYYNLEDNYEYYNEILKILENLLNDDENYINDYLNIYMYIKYIIYINDKNKINKIILKDYVIN